MSAFDTPSRHKLANLFFLSALLTVGVSQSLHAELVTIWEDQFTSVSPDWEFPEHGGLSLVSQPVPEGVVGSEDGFEGRFTNTIGQTSEIYIIRTLPADLILPGDRVEYSIRTDYPTKYAGDRINLVAPPGGFDFDSGFVAHDSPGGLTYKKEPGTYFDLFDTTLLDGIRPEQNLWFGNSGHHGPGEESVFYVDYIRILGERTITLGDYNRNGSIDAADYTVWRDTLGIEVESGTGADGDGNGVIEENDYSIWKSAFIAGSGAAAASAVPEPTSLSILLMGMCWIIAGIRRAKSLCYLP